MGDTLGYGKEIGVYELGDTGFPLDLRLLYMFRPIDVDSGSPNPVQTSDVTAWLSFNTPGLGSALAAQGFKNMKPKPWAELCDGSGSASA